MTKEVVLAGLARAFQAARRPESPERLTTGGIDGPYVVKHFLGKDRAEVEEGFLPSLHMKDFTYMTVEAIAYYLPAPLRLMLETPYDDELWLYLHGFLRPGKGYREGVWDLAPSQLEAIAEWARYLAEAWERELPAFFDADDVARAAELARAYQQPRG